MTDKTGPPRRERIRVRVDRLRQSRQRSTVGVAELAGLAASAIMLLAVVFVYLSFYSPAQSRLAKAQIERASLQQKLSELQKNVDLRGSEKDSASRIVESIDTFESDHLTGRDEGRVTLYNTLIQLIKSNSLRNTAGPAYTYLEAKGENRNQGPRLGNAKWQSLYPGIAVTVTVEGQYANLRHFVRDIESSRQFIIINEIELERASDADTLVTTPGTAAPRSNLVSLKVDMTAYYRRESGGEVVEQQPPPASQAR
ncbi:MAG TPA: GspMb/PilO family protein [Pyrinomonadaceae bacterium]|nr:GspMb/PilO family protein [Pyrinomonadaceae bacterium]